MTFLVMNVTRRTRSAVESAVVLDRLKRIVAWDDVDFERSLVTLRDAKGTKTETVPIQGCGRQSRKRFSAVSSTMDNVVELVKH